MEEPFSPGWGREMRGGKVGKGRAWRGLGASAGALNASLKTDGGAI
jgi:hypothetical protein